MNTKHNRQYRDSAARMKQALLELMGTVPPEKLTVRLVCGRAGVNRSTFYAHYEDLPHMILEMEADLHRRLMEDYPVPGGVMPLSEASFLPFLRFIRRHRAFYRTALKARRAFPLEQGFEPLWEQVAEPLCRRAGIEDPGEMMLYFVGFQAGLTTVLARWVDGGCSQDEAQVARILQDLVPAIWK